MPYLFIRPSMKFNRLFLSAILFSFVLFPSCKPDQPAAPADARDMYVAHWTCNEQSSQIGASTFTVQIDKSTTSATQITIANFYNLGSAYKAIADISGNNITIPQQTLNSNQLHGSGTKSGPNSVNLTYYMNNGSTIDTCVSTLTRQ